LNDDISPETDVADEQNATEHAVDRSSEQSAPNGATAPLYDHRAIERRWQAAWQDAGLYITPSAADLGDRRAYIFAEHAAPALSAPFELIRSYAIADSYARFLRGRGVSVLFSLGIAGFGAGVELDAVAHKVTPAEWVDRCITRIGRQLSRLGVSLDFSRAFSTADADTYQSSQLLFLTLLEQGIIHRSDERWRVRLGRYMQENEDRFRELHDWDELALASQRSSQGFIEGVEFEVASLDGTPLTVFTTHVNAIKEAEFVAISPNHPDIEQWISPSELEIQLGVQPVLGTPGPDTEATSDSRPVSEVAIDTGRVVTGAGAKAPLPVIVSAAVDARFGAIAVLGIPEVDEVDASLAKRLNPANTKAWRITDGGPSKLRPAKRFSDRDIAISHQRSWGTPIPVVYCKKCGVVPVAVEDLPVRLPEGLPASKSANLLERDEEFLLCKCPRCGAKARRETETLEPRFDGLWQWIAPGAKRIGAHGLFDDPELARWLPVKRAVRGADEDESIFSQRMGAKVLRDCGLLPYLSDGEPFAGVTMHQRVQKGRAKEVNHLDGLIRGSGADALRLMMLHGAAPRTVLTWRGHTLQHCHKWLRSFWLYALPRLQKLRELPEIDEDQGAVVLRRRLAKWSRIAVERVTENYERLEPHRAARNVMAFLVRIEDFEQRVIDRQGELTPADERALAEALIVAVQLIAPLTPYIAEELWSAAGREGFVAASPWPPRGE
jgi:leucyl-tRNA synthetase